MPASPEVQMFSLRLDDNVVALQADRLRQDSYHYTPQYPPLSTVHGVSLGNRNRS